MRPCDHVRGVIYETEKFLLLNTEQRLDYILLGSGDPSIANKTTLPGIKGIANETTGNETTPGHQKDRDLPIGILLSEAFNVTNLNDTSWHKNATFITDRNAADWKNGVLLRCTWFINTKSAQRVPAHTYPNALDRMLPALDMEESEQVRPHVARTLPLATPSELRF